MKDPRLGDRVIIKKTSRWPEMRGRIIRLTFLEGTKSGKMASGPKDGQPDIGVEIDGEISREVRKVVESRQSERWQWTTRFYAKELELENVMDRLAREA